MNRYEYEEAKVYLEEAKGISRRRIDAYVEEVYLLYLSGDYDACVSLGETYINTLPFQVEAEADKEQLGNLY